MRKTLFIVLLITLSATVAHSQVLIALLVGDKLNSERFELGIKVAGNWEDFTGLEGTSSQFDFGFGIYGTAKLSRSLCLQPELLFKDPRGASGIKGVVFGDPNLDPLLEDASVSAKLSYVTLPVLLQYSLSPRLNVGIGPQFGYLTGARNEYVSGVQSDDDLVYKDDIMSTMNKFDAAVAFNLEYKLRTKKGLHLGLRYYLGLTDVMKDNPGDPVRNAVLQLNLGIPLGHVPEDK